jgi:mono/diheme cytochrome c family protein
VISHASRGPAFRRSGRFRGLVYASCLIGACEAPHASGGRPAEVEREAAAPETYLPGDLDTRPDSAKLVLSRHVFDTDEEAQPDTLPALAVGMTLEMIRTGDRLFHGAGGCVNCHGSEAQGLAARGKTLTAGLAYVPAGSWNALDSLISVGMPDERTRSPIAMPPRGQHSDLAASEIRMIAAYVWAISQTRGEPWAGGHAVHASHDWRASARTSIP